jgi:preprotein translocase SecE subunit
MNVKRYVNMGFVITGLLAWICLSPLYAYLLEWLAPAWDMHVIGVEIRVSDILGFVSAILFAIYLWMREDVYTAALEIGNELSKVTWPKWKETKVSTIVVIITTLIIAAILGVLDLVWAKVTNYIYSIG